MDLQYKLTFGKYKGETLQWLIDNHPEYLFWAFYNVKWINEAVKQMSESDMTTLKKIIKEQKLLSDQRWDKMVNSVYRPSSIQNFDHHF